MFNTVFLALTFLYFLLKIKWHFFTLDSNIVLLIKILEVILTTFVKDGWYKVDYSEYFLKILVIIKTGRAFWPMLHPWDQT